MAKIKGAHVGSIEGCEIGILGKQAGAPTFNFHFKIK
jgi:hypothetical protein